MVALIGVFEGFVAVNDGKVFGPEASKPMAVLLLVQL
jgi:hypothetical protein